MNGVTKAVFVLLAGGAGLAGGGTSGGTGAAHAQEPCKTSIQVSNLGIYSTRIYSVRAMWARCGASAATWDMKQGNEWLGYWYFPPSPQYQSYYPGYDPVGRFNATPRGAYEGNYSYVPQNGTTFYVKLNSRISFSGYRSGRSVFVRARVTRFNPRMDWGTGGWQNSVNRRVVFYDAVGGRWRWRGVRYTGNNGYTRYLRLDAPWRRQFKAAVAQTPTIWGRTSNAYRR